MSTPAKGLEQLAARLRRPALSLSELTQLSPAQLEALDAAVAQAAARQRAQVDESLRRALPGWLLVLVLGRGWSRRP